MTLQSLISEVLGTIINPLFPILIGFALVLFIWGLIQYLRGGLGEKELAGAKSLMLWGVITLFVMVSVWGLVGILQQTFFGGAPTSAPTSIPQFGDDPFGGPWVIPDRQDD